MSKTSNLLAFLALSTLLFFTLGANPTIDLQFNGFPKSMLIFEDRFLLSAQSDGVYFLDLTDNYSYQILNSSCSQLVLSPQANVVYCATADQRQIWKLDGERNFTIQKSFDLNSSSCQPQENLYQPGPFLATEQYLVKACVFVDEPNASLEIFDTEKEEFVQQIEVENYYNYRLAIDTFSSKIYSVLTNSEGKINFGYYQIGTSSDFAKITQLDINTSHVLVSSDESWAIIYQEYDGTMQVVDIVHGNTGQPEQFLRTPPLKTSADVIYSVWQETLYSPAEITSLTVDTSNWGLVTRNKYEIFFEDLAFFLPVIYKNNVILQIGFGADIYVYIDTLNNDRITKVNDFSAGLPGPFQSSNGSVIYPTTEGFAMFTSEGKFQYFDPFSFDSYQLLPSDPALLYMLSGFNNGTNYTPYCLTIMNTTNYDIIQTWFHAPYTGAYQYNHIFSVQRLENNTIDLIYGLPLPSRQVARVVDSKFITFGSVFSDYESLYYFTIVQGKSGVFFGQKEGSQKSVDTMYVNLWTGAVTKVVSIPGFMVRKIDDYTPVVAVEYLNSTIINVYNITEMKIKESTTVSLANVKDFVVINGYGYGVQLQYDDVYFVDKNGNSKRIEVNNAYANTEIQFGVTEGTLIIRNFNEAFGQYIVYDAKNDESRIVERIEM